MNEMEDLSHGLQVVIQQQDDEVAYEAASEAGGEEENFDEIIRSINDPRRMRLKQEDIDNALVIKDAIGMLPELDSVLDLMCAQLAIVDGDDVEKSMAVPSPAAILPRRVWSNGHLRRWL